MPGIVKGVVNPNVLNAFTALHWEYAQFLEETPEPWSDLILEEVPASPMLSDQFFIDLTTGGFRPWNGDRQMRDTMQDSFTVNKRAFEDSMKIPKLLAMNGVYQAMARSEAQRFASNLFTFRDDMANNMLRNGSSATLGKCWDGGAFFSATHPIDTRGDLTKVFSNKIALSGFTAPNWATVKAQLESVPAPNGKPYRAMVTGIIYPPAREPNIKAVFGKEHLTGGEHPWPGNVRELENVIERAVVLCDDTLVDVEQLPSDILSAAVPHLRAGAILPLQDVERQYILAVLEANGGNRTKTAVDLRIGAATLYRKLKAYGVSVSQ